MSTKKVIALERVGLTWVPFHRNSKCQAVSKKVCRQEPTSLEPAWSQNIAVAVLLWPAMIGGKAWLFE